MRTREPVVEPLVNLSEITEIELLVLKRMRELTMGEHRSLYHGSGYDLVGLRDWQAGDRLTAIDWPQSSIAGFNPMVVREFEQPGTAPVVALADRSASTRCGIDGVPIAAIVARAVATIGMSAVFFQDMFGLMTFDDGFRNVSAVPPRIGKAQVMHCLDAYARGPDTPYAREPAPGTRSPTPEASRLSQTIAGFLRRTSLVPVVSDFLFDDPQGILRELSHLQSTHDVFLVIVDSAPAFALPRVASGWIETVDVETGRSRLMSRSALRGLADRVRVWQDDVERMARDVDIDVLRFGIDPVQSSVSLVEFVADDCGRCDVACIGHFGSGSVARRPDRKARRVRISGICKREQRGMHRLRGTVEMTDTGHQMANRSVRVRTIRWWVRCAAVMLLSLIARPADGQTQPAQDAPAGAPPIECWWRTDRGAVRVGEPFSLVLTCAVVESDAIRIVPDETRLDRAALQVAPFEVLSGAHPPDLRVGERRFFQYAYTLRVIGDDVFGKDVALPAVSIGFRIESRVKDETVQGRDLAYVLPSTSIRVLSSVPAVARDPRDPPLESFDAIQARTFRANALLVIGAALMAIGVLTALTAAVQVTRRAAGQEADAGRLVSDSAILAAARRQLAGVRREAADGWSTELAGRADSALRVAGGYAVGRRISQTAMAGKTTRPASRPAAQGSAQDGHLVVRGGSLRGTRVLVSSSVTADLAARELTHTDAGETRRQRLETLQAALVRFNAARFGRETTLDSSGLDEAVTSSLALVTRLQFEHRWFMRSLNALRTSAGELGNRLWAR